MKELPRIFSTPMVQAINRESNFKTQTRRIDGLELVNEDPDSFRHLHEVNQDDIPRVAIKYDDRKYYLFWKKWSNHADYVVRGPYKVGDTIWVRESFAYEEYTPEDWCCFNYKADHNESTLGKWKPSIHMPRTAARIFLRITNVRIERVNDISEDDAKAEGADIGRVFGLGQIGGSHREGFIVLWDSIYFKRASWESNPWVWVITFERIPENI